MEKLKIRSKLIELRKEKGLTQQQIAKLLNISRACYSNYENGSRNPNFKIILEMKKIFNVKEDKFFLKDKDTISNK